MTEEHFDRLVREADPARLDLVGQLDGVKQTLLGEIMSESTLGRFVQPPRRQPRVRRFAGVAAVVVVLAGVLAVSVLPGESGEVGEVASAPSAGAPVVYSPVAMRAAEKNPRLLINQPGWKATTVYGFTQEMGTITFRKGGRELEFDWYSADGYADRYADRLHVNRPKAVQVDGWPGDQFEYSASDFEVLLRPRDGVFVELQTGGDWSRKEFARVLANVVRVDARTWLGALPPEIVIPERALARAAEVLADVPLPPGFDVAALVDVGINDPYQFGAAVTSRVGCGWIAEWQRARASGDEAGVRRTVEALRSSHGWRVLRDMDKAGDWPEVFWEYADEIAAGTLRASYSQGLGCA
ncbi:hypothetical protein F8280_07535 [Micromonospora noduli]|uniref:hypothetical protein n=1 Tax=Micromonospora noduli TaxID=709876 RepID=UPI00124B5824|nr:hypothetical protein [Micromonospora noduli]KAB1927218.1 hypothetical protein F8280_07535 [Micromonospora noduli]